MLKSYMILKELFKTFIVEILQYNEVDEETSTAAPATPINTPPMTEAETTLPTRTKSSIIRPIRPTLSDNVHGDSDELAFWQTTEPPVVSTVPVTAAMDIGLIVGILVAVIVVLLVLVLLLYCRHRRYQKNSVSTNEYVLLCFLIDCSFSPSLLSETLFFCLF